MWKGTVAWRDFDTNGSLDLALSGNDATSASIARIYRNDANGASNAPPGAPSNLTNVVFRKSVRLSWNAPADTNQTAGLGYNLRVGTSPGGGGIVSPLSDSNGARKVVAPGNANERQSWTITNLTGGTFYWSVQAVDHSFAGSAFATERSFLITNLAPVAATKSATTAEDTSVGITLTGSDPDNDPVTFSFAGQPRFGTLSGTPPNVTCRPVTNYFGFDQFTYRANDRTTDSAPASVYITVTSVQDVTASTLAISPAAGGQYWLGLSAEPWRSYSIEASEDLVHRTPITNFIGTNLLTQLMDADAVNFTQRFYRAALFSMVPAIDSGAQWAGNQFQFYITGESGRAYQIQTSTNLADWLPIGTLVMTNAQLPFIDRDAQNFPQRFYRIVSP